MRSLNFSKIFVGGCAAVVAVMLAACGAGMDSGGVSDASMASGTGVDVVQSRVESPDDVVGMSGRYQVTREGKLLPYASAPRVDKPELTEVARVYDNNGAEAFARYFIRVVEYTWDSGDSALLREISLPSCEWCEYVASSTEERAANKGWVRNLRTRVLSVEQAFEVPEHPGVWQVEATIETSAYDEYTGKELKKIPEEKAYLLLQMRDVDGAWRVSGSLGEAAS